MSHTAPETLKLALLALGAIWAAARLRVRVAVAVKPQRRRSRR